MLTIAVMSTLCVAGAGFYVRFLLALWREARPQRSGYWMLLRVRDQDEPAHQASDLDELATRAA